MGLKDKITSAVLIIFAGTLLGKLLGFFRDIIIAAIFGAGESTDAFFAGLIIPELLRDILVGSALTSAFIPVFSGYLARKDYREGLKLANDLINFLFLLLCGMAAIGVIFAPLLVRIVVPGFRGDVFGLTVGLCRFLFPAMIFFGLSSLLMAILNSYKHFAAPSFTPAVLNVAIIIAALSLSTKIGIKALVVGFFIGGILQLLIQMPVLRRLKFDYQFSLDFYWPAIKKVMVLWLPLFIGLSANHLNIIVNKMLASTLSYGCITALTFADRLNQLPIGIFGITLSTAVFPFLSWQRAEEKKEEFKKTFSMGLRWAFFLSFPITLIFIFFNVPIIKLIFERRAFDAADTILTSRALLFYGIGSFAITINYMFLRGYHALQDMVTPVKIAILGVALNILFNLILIGPLKHGGLALGFSLAAIIQMLVFAFSFNKKIVGLPTKEISSSVMKVGAASVSSVGVAYIFTKCFFAGSPFLQLSMALLIIFSVFMIFHFAIGIDEIRLVKEIIRHRLRI